MQRLRSVWLAFVGGSLILAFSVSATIGAPPTDTDGPRGQSISAFVHELIFGSEEETEGDEVVDEDEDVDEDETDEDVDETDEDTASEDAEREVPEEFANHGECVSEAAHDQEGFEASDAKNRGEWVSTHARYTCWGLEPPDAEAEEADADEADSDSDEDGADDRATAKAERKAAREAAKAEREAAKAERSEARDAAKAERSAARDAAKAERQVAHAERKAGKGH
jgi:hypothetical protein